MYKIIGGDGRANAQTQAQAEGSTEWKPLSAWPEISGPAAPPPVTPPMACAPSTPAVDQRKSKIAAGLLGIFLGAWGIHRFYLGYTGIGIAQILVTVCTCGIGALWGFIEGILILCGSSITTDAQGRPLRD